MIYLDNAATTLQKPPNVAEAVAKAISSLGNAGRGAHAPTLDAARVIYDTRGKLAQVFNAEDPSDMAFTANATDSLNIVLQSIFTSSDHVVTTACEHNSVLRPLYMMRNKGMQLTVLPADVLGNIDYCDLEKAVRKNTKAIVITHASNLTGNVTDMYKVAEIAKKHGLLLIADASQTAGTFPIDVQAMGIDILCFTGHKGLFGPQGTGGIYVRHGVAVKPFKVGGSGIHSFDENHPALMPTVFEAGTLNSHGLAGLNAGVDFILHTGVEKIHQHEMQLANTFYKAVKDINGVRLYGDYEAEERTAIVTLNIGNMDSGTVSDILWEEYRICVRGGAHCAPLMHKTFGTEKQGAVRFSFGFFNMLAEVKAAAAAVKDIAEGL